MNNLNVRSCLAVGYVFIVFILIKMKSKMIYKVTVTYNAVLHTEAQLKFWVRSLDNCHGDRRAVNDTELHLCLVFKILLQKQKWKIHNTNTRKMSAKINVSVTLKYLFTNCILCFLDNERHSQNERSIVCVCVCPCMCMEYI